MAMVRQEATEEGPHHHALHLSEVRHRGAAVHQAMLERAGHRRRRRSANLRYRPPRFDHRRRPQGWLPPSLTSRVGNVLNWTRRCGRWAPVRRIEVERVKFDPQLLQNPEISCIEYQQGERAGWETRAYLLEKFGQEWMRASSRRWPSQRWVGGAMVAPTLTSMASHAAISCARSRSGASRRATVCERSCLPGSPRVARIPDASRSAPTGSFAWA